MLDSYPALITQLGLGQFGPEKREEQATTPKHSWLPPTDCLFPKWPRVISEAQHSKLSTRVLGEASVGHTWRAQQIRQNSSMSMEHAEVTQQPMLMARDTRDYWGDRCLLGLCQDSVVPVSGDLRHVALLFVSRNQRAIAFPKKCF